MEFRITPSTRREPWMRGIMAKLTSVPGVVDTPTPSEFEIIGNKLEKRKQI